MSSPRIAQLKALVDRLPEDARARYFLAHELLRAEDWQGAAEQYEAYLLLTPGDEGFGFLNHGRCLERLGRQPEAAEVYRRGIQAALAHNHAGLAAEIEEALAGLDR